MLAPFVALLALACARPARSAAADAFVYRLAEELPLGTFVANLSADAHLAGLYPDAPLRYSLLASPGTAVGRRLVAVGTMSGVLVLAARVDRDVLCPPADEPCALTLDVVVTPARYFRMLSVTLVIDDVNDNAPTFRDAEVTLSIAESAAVGSRFSLPTAADADGARFGLQRYVLTPQGDAPFALEMASALEDGSATLSLVLTSPLDREQRDAYHLKISAVDGGSPPRSAQLALTVTVTDVNDNRPVFARAEYEGALAEDAPAGQLVLTLSATDADSGARGRVLYGFTARTALRHATLFAVDAVSGELRLRAATLDYERETRYTLGVTARDGSARPPTTARVTVRVRDVNDNAPVVEVAALSGDAPAVSEAAPVGTFVAFLSAYDRDAGQNGVVSCRLTHDAFRLQPIRDGQWKVVTTVALDRERVAAYHLTVTCRDDGRPRLSAEARLRVRVDDVNDNRPVFGRKSYAVQVRENNRPGLVLVNVSATDADAGDAGDIEYRALGDDAGATNWLRVDAASGAVSAWRSLDRETLAVLRLRVEARDRGRPRALASVVRVTVIVVDENDEPPVFSDDDDDDGYTFAVAEDAPVNAVVGDVTATDADSETDHRAMRYSLRAPPPATFVIDEHSGTIRTRARLDREARDLYALAVVATNTGAPHLSCVVTVTVRVTDVNDNTPVIYHPATHHADNSTVRLSNRLAIGQRVSRVIAVDADVGENGRLLYTFPKREEIARFFAINATSGVVTVVGDLLGIVYRQFRIELTVSDHGTPPRVATGVLAIVVNESISLPSSPVTPRRTSNVTAVACVVTLSAVVTCCLLVFIVRTVRKNKMAAHRKGDAEITPLPVNAANNSGDSQECELRGTVSVERETTWADDIQRARECSGLYGLPISPPSVQGEQQDVTLREVSKRALILRAHTCTRAYACA